MIFHKLGLLNKSQMGFTMIELLIAIAIGSIIAGATTMTTLQMITGTSRSNNHMTAVRQVQYAGYWVSHDAQMAQSMALDDEATENETEMLTLAWVGWEYESDHNTTCINTSKVHYIYHADSDQIWRHQEITTAEYDADGQLVDPQPEPQNSTAIIAEYITPTPIVNLGTSKLALTITAAVGEAEEERTYEITPRPST